MEDTLESIGEVGVKIPQISYAASSWRSGPDQGLDDVRCLTSLASDPSLPKVPTQLDQLTAAYYDTFLKLTVLFLIFIRTASAEER